MTLLGFLAPTPFQIVVVLVLGVLIFGKNLPDVAKQIGFALGEFKKGLSELTDITKGVTKPSKTKIARTEDRSEAEISKTDKHSETGTKFEPPV